MTAYEKLVSELPVEARSHLYSLIGKAANGMFHDGISSDDAEGICVWLMLHTSYPLEAQEGITEGIANALRAIEAHSYDLQSE